MAIFCKARNISRSLRYWTLTEMNKGDNFLKKLWCFVGGVLRDDFALSTESKGRFLCLFQILQFTQMQQYWFKLTSETRCRRCWKVATNQVNTEDISIHGRHTSVMVLIYWTKTVQPSSPWLRHLIDCTFRIFLGLLKVGLRTAFAHISNLVEQYYKCVQG